MFAIETRRQQSADSFRYFCELAANAIWERRPFPAYWSADVTENCPAFDGDAVFRAFFVCLVPGGEIHRHRDAGDVKSRHLVISTNPKALNFWADDEGEHSQHMEQGKTYWVDRSLEHWARNDGDTPRVHLIIETRK